MGGKGPARRPSKTGWKTTTYHEGNCSIMSTNEPRTDKPIFFGTFLLLLAA